MVYSSAGGQGAVLTTAAPDPILRGQDLYLSGSRVVLCVALSVFVWRSDVCYILLVSPFPPPHCVRAYSVWPH